MFCRLVCQVKRTSLLPYERVGFGRGDSDEIRLVRRDGLRHVKSSQDKMMTGGGAGGSTREKQD